MKCEILKVVVFKTLLFLLLVVPVSAAEITIPVNKRQQVALPDIKVDVIEVGILKERDKEDIPFFDPFTLRLKKAVIGRSVQAKKRNYEALAKDYKLRKLEKYYLPKSYFGNVYLLGGNEGFSELDFFEGTQSLFWNQMLSLHNVSGNKVENPDIDTEAPFTAQELTFQYKRERIAGKYIQLNISASREELTLIGDEMYTYNDYTREGSYNGLRVDYGNNTYPLFDAISFRYNKNSEKDDNAGVASEIEETIQGLSFSRKLKAKIPLSFDLDFEKRLYGNDESVDQKSLKAETKLNYLDRRLNFRGGLIVADVADYQSIQEPLLDLTYFFNDDHTVSLSLAYSRKFEAPLMERYFQGKDYLNLSYDWIVPTIKRTSSVGTDIRFSNGMVIGGTYSEERDDWMNVLDEPAGSEDGLWDLVPLADIKTKSVEVRLYEYTFREIKPYFTYRTYTSEIVGANYFVVPYIPDYVYALGLKSTTDFITASLEYKYTGERYYDMDEIEEKLEGYGVLNMDLEKKLWSESFHLLLRGENITGTEYQPVKGYTFAKRHYSAGIRYKF